MASGARSFPSDVNALLEPVGGMMQGNLNGNWDWESKTHMKRGFLSSLFVAGLMVAGPCWAKETPAIANGDLELAHRLEAAFEKVAAQASESVVVISTKTKMQARLSGDEEDNGGMDQFKGTPFEYFFRQHGMPSPIPRESEGQGSGIIIRPDGYILTNNHVVDGTDTITVRLKDGREFGAKVIGTDPRTDVAVIKIDGKDLPVARLGDSDKVRVGQWAIAIGAPYELDYTFTVGFVSAKGRSAVWSRSGSAYEDYIQTDASINPGNSGGPLCDIDGRVIGINAMIRGLNRGIGFAIPINMAKEISDQLIEKGRVIRPWLGISIEPLSENKELSDTVKEGVVVREVRPNTPAAKSDLQPADIIVGVDGVPVKSPKELQIQILRKKVGETVALDVVRGGKPLTVKLTTAEMSDQLQTASRKGSGKSATESAFGLTVQTLSADLAKQFDVEATGGVVVTDVADGSVADQKGLQRGDVITEVDRAPVRDAEQFKAAMTKADAKKGVLVFVKRAGVPTFVVLKEP
jgi:serine protease Do